MIEIGHDAQHAQAAVLLNQRHRVGVCGKQDLLVEWRCVILARQIGDDGLARIPLEARNQC